MEKNNKKQKLWNRSSRINTLFRAGLYKRNKKKSLVTLILAEELEEKEEQKSLKKKLSKEAVA
jgi:hypothetical protein